MNTKSLIATFTLATATLTHAQITSPDKLVAPPPRNPADRPHVKPVTDLQWLWRYTRPAPNGDKIALLQDQRFTQLLRDDLKAPQAMWGKGVPLSEAAKAFLAGSGTISSTDNRHLTITGSTADFPTQRGLVYLDLGEPNPLVVFATLRWNEQSRTTDDPAAPYTLWIFPSRELNSEELPTSLKDAIAQTFAAGCKPPNIVNTLVVEPNGIPHIAGTLTVGLHPNLCNDTTR